MEAPSWLRGTVRIAGGHVKSVPRIFTGSASKQALACKIGIGWRGPSGGMEWRNGKQSGACCRIPPVARLPIGRPALGSYRPMPATYDIRDPIHGTITITEGRNVGRSIIPGCSGCAASASSASSAWSIPGAVHDRFQHSLGGDASRRRPLPPAERGEAAVVLRLLRRRSRLRPPRAALSPDCSTTSAIRPSAIPPRPTSRRWRRCCCRPPGTAMGSVRPVARPPTRICRWR